MTEQRETLDEFMERTKDAGYPGSIRRLAWMTGEPLEKVWRQFQAARAEAGTEHMPRFEDA